MLQDIRELNRRAVLASVEVVSKATTADLSRTTPCSEWNLSDLLAHMTAQHFGFAAAVRGNGANLKSWEVRPLGDDPASEYAKAADHVIAAFAEDGVLERKVSLAE